MLRPPVPSSARVFPLFKDKRATLRWKAAAGPASEYDFLRSNAYGLIADGFAVIDFDDLKSRAIWPEGNLAHFCAVDGLTPEALAQRAPMVKTPHGYHLIVAEDPAIDQNQGFRLPDGTPTEIDVRAHGKGYVVGPGSIFRSNRENAAKHPDEPMGSILRYQPLYERWPDELPSLRDLLPTVYAIVTSRAPASASSPALALSPPTSTTPSTSTPAPTSPTSSSGIQFSPSAKSGRYDGSHNWIPRDWASGLREMRSAEKGTRHWIMVGCARYLWRYRNRPQYDTMLDEYWAAARETGYSDRDIQHLLDDFVGSKLEQDHAAVAATIAARTASEPSVPATPDEPDEPATDDAPKFILTKKGDEVVKCEANLRIAIQRGIIKTDDFAINCRGELVHYPTRDLQRAGKITAHAADYEASAIMVERIDRFFGGSMRTRSVLLPIAAEEIGKKRTESLAPDFFQAITSSGPSVSIAELVDRMGVDSRPQVVRWVEACLLQALRRMLRPGAPLENILLLWGAQRTHKTTFIPALFDPSFTDAASAEYMEGWSFTDTLCGDLRDEQAVGQRCKAKFALEIPELTAFRRTRDVGALRDVITRTHDSYRAPYGRRPEKQARTCTFVGTSNEEPELGDQYGNRRFCVIRIARPIDTSWIVEHRTEIWRGLYQVLQADPLRAVLTAEEQAEKEKSLEPNTFMAIPYFGEICEAVDAVACRASGRQYLCLTEITKELTVEQGGPHLQNTDLLRRAIGDVLRHLGATRRAGRYPTYVWGALQRGKLDAWMSSSEESPAVDEPSAMPAQTPTPAPTQTPTPAPTPTPPPASTPTASAVPVAMAAAPQPVAPPPVQIPPPVARLIVGSPEYELRKRLITQLREELFLAWPAEAATTPTPTPNTKRRIVS